MTTFDQRVVGVAIVGGFGWPIEENRLAIASIDFRDTRGEHFLTVKASGDNQKSRAFIEHKMNPNLFLGSELDIELNLTAFYELQEIGEGFYGDDLWYGDLSETHHPFVYGLREGCTAVVHLKENGRNIRANRSA